MEEQRKSENALVPALRFEGFSDPWEQRRLGEICDEVTRRNPLSEAPVMMITAESGFIEQSERYSTDNAGESLQKYIVLRRGELAYNHGASKLRPFGSCFNLLADEARIPFVYHCFSLRSDCPAFTSLELNGGQVEDQLRTLVSSGARMDGLLNISFEEYQTVRLLLPSLDEQRQIAGLFAKLDSLIALHQRKHEKLKTVKQSLLEKMFPKEGEDVPEIRFEGFTDPWEQRRLGEVVDVRSGRDYKHLKPGLIPVYGTGGLMTYVNEALSKNEDAIGIGRKGTIDQPYKLYAPFWTVDTLFYAIPKIGIDIEFALSCFLRINWKAKDESTGLPSLSKSAINDTRILLPDAREQSRIGTLFSKLDSLIALHQRELDILKNLKQALLEKMFV
ncbi:restriction endonuclease subunit S [Adlercreutzia equolifaciens]